MSTVQFEFPQMHMAISFLNEVQRRFPQHKAELTIVRSVTSFIHTNGVPHQLHVPWVDVERKIDFANEPALNDLAQEYGSIGFQT